MKRYFLLLFSIAAFSHSPSEAFITGMDTVQDQLCDKKVFYGAGGQNLHRVQKIGKTITERCIITPSSFDSLYQ